ncbi:MAG: IS66 family insertion sequence element accessory protein TnpB [Polyangiaceae bacterium]|nr:IS66 family insertion sequence element accessory protein TnpB [Polyangiaceae bacterium]
MLESFLPNSAKRVVLHLEPIDVRWGPNKLATFCREALRIEPDPSTCFLFVNRRRDTLLMYFLGNDGGETLMKRLDKGSFLLPAPNADGAPYVVLRPSMLPRLFRT